MKQENSDDAAAHDPSSAVGGSAIELAIPIRDGDLFKHGASAHVLNFLADNPELRLSLRELSTVVPFTERATREAVDVLAANDLVTTVDESPARLVQINHDRLSSEDDPFLSIPQSEYRLPTRIAAQYLTDELTDVRGIVLFGSVARGGADRRSDIDLWVLVGEDLMDNKHRANKLVGKLNGLQIPPAVGYYASEGGIGESWDQVREELEDDEQDWASAERYEFEVVVESPGSFLNQRDRIDTEIFTQGITLHDSDLLELVKQEVVGDE